MKKYIKNLKSERGSISTLVLATVLFFTLLLSTAYLIASTQRKAQLKSEESLKDTYGKEVGIVDSVYVSTQIGVIMEESSTIDGKEATYSNPIIPAGFKAVNTEGAKWDGENGPEFEVGLVIEDTEGNQFVWVPVDGVDLKYATHTYSYKESGTSSADEETNCYDDDGWRTLSYSAYTWTDEYANSESVEKYGGFYIARYEAGVPAIAPFYANSDGATYYTSDTIISKNTTAYTPVSKAKNQSWNFISQENALAVSEKMYESSTSVSSQLIDSSAWDTVTQWIQNSKNVTDSSDWGNYSNSSSAITANGLYAVHIYKSATDTSFLQYAANYKKGILSLGGETIGTSSADSDAGYKSTRLKEIATGSSSDTVANNIYDFAGNMYEWTTEVASRTDETDLVSYNYAVIRGGGFDSNGSQSPASYRGGNNQTTYSDCNIGFRVVLYVK